MDSRRNQLKGPEQANVPPGPAPAEVIPPAVAGAPVTKTNEPPRTAEYAAAVEVQETLTPIQVKTVKAKLAQMAELGPAIVQIREEPANLARFPMPPSKTLAAAARGTLVTPAVGLPAAVVEPGPNAGPPPKATVYAFKPTMVSATSAPVERQAAGTARRDAKGFVGAQSAATHGSWIVQIGAFDIEREAQQRLSNARAKVGHVLDHAQSFTETVSKGEKTLYRARLAGFQQKDDAEAACKQLKQNDFDCMIIRN